MPIPIAAAVLLASQCAPSVAPETLLSVVHVESRFDPLAIGVNGAPRVTVQASTKGEAVARASELIAAGRSVDLGLGQINSRNLGRLGLTLEDAFEPCANLAAAARVLSEGYGRARVRAGADQVALQTALSFYNTGRADRGFANGYVGKVLRAATRFVPALTTPRATPRAPTPGPADPLTEAAPPAPAWDVFGESLNTSPSFVLRVSTQLAGDQP